MSAPRIVSLLAGATDIVCELGCADQLVAIGHECDHQALSGLDLPVVTRSRIDAHTAGDIDRQVKQLLESGQALYELDGTLLESLQPDLILTQAQCEVCAIPLGEVHRVVADLPGASRAEVLALEVHDIVDLLDAVRQVAAHAGGSPDFVTQLEQRIATVNERSKRAELLRPRVACVEWLEPMMLSGNWVPQLIRLAGGTPVLARDSGPSRYWDWSKLIAEDPQVLIFTPCGFALDRIEQDVQSAAWPGELTGTAAVREGRVYAADGNVFFNRPGPELVTTLEWLAFLLHPELHPQPAANHPERVRRLPL